MPWWFWIVLWAVLIACTAGAAVGGGFWLVRKALRVLHDAGESLAGLATPRVVGGAEDGPGHEDAAPPKPGSAVFADPDAMRTVYERGRLERREARVARRVARRSQRGQPQSLRDLGLI